MKALAKANGLSGPLLRLEEQLDDQEMENDELRAKTNQMELAVKESAAAAAHAAEVAADSKKEQLCIDGHLVARIH